MTTSTKKIISFSLKAAVLVMAAWYIYHQFYKKNDDLKQFKALTARIDSTHVFVAMGIVVLLMVVNWVLEAFKWRYLTKNLVNITIWESIEAVFCGLTWAISTPNRVGEYGGRVMFLPNRKRIHGVFAMAVGAFGQIIMTNLLGLIAIIWFVYLFIPVSTWLFCLIILVSALTLAILLIFFFHIKWIVNLLDRIGFLKKYHKFFEIMGRYKTNELIRILGFSMARYVTFTIQYCIVFHLLIPDFAYFPMVMILFVYFFITSALPSLDLLDVGVRSFTASHLFAYVTDQKIAVIAGVSSIWLINLIIPAILGSLFVFKLKFFDRTA
ncbi:lysylphosphatidylglycerol synthase domain-containing protein [Mucilaginibacter sabulilitoris]|uniref:Lysylphosphatidylglycerol synthase domain-containing protein n=1 Tax=Mucilaginibacter sabulilitoris TaxID=1173583 RepID=A0ABZ0TM18_9SPHI|nr:lysylphosphatidylglycerol synthase domain-containing protein [Mucilaginibacter sabulilitoris]WPU94202.1 lysylphosphatidylglycerol synthase domain-containing protein [Mucilaginibacter sabulilitoris]